tara:strand:- start:398 stop:613 length:216 start_codon:yes stop_codon:yes gene_type:complete
MKYTAEERMIQYNDEYSSMTKIEKQIQKKFESTIELLVLYKQSNPKEEVYLSEEYINKALQWFTENLNIEK